MWRYKVIHILLTPFILFSSILTEISLNENHKIKGIVVTAETQVDRDLMAVTPGDWILMKGLIESNDGECKAIINDGIAICKHQLEVCHDTCSSIPQHQKNVLNVMTLDLKNSQLDLKKAQQQNKILKYVAIGLGTFAVGSTTFFILK